MSKYQIAVIVGSLRKDSFNRKLAGAIARLAPDDYVFTETGIGDLPLYNQDDDDDPAPAVKRFKADVAAARGLLFVTPEYNRSIPGVLKNAIDHGSRPYGKSVWTGKPAGIVGISPGPLGTALAQQHLRNILSCLDVPTLPRPEVYLQMKDGLFDESGAIGAASRDFLQGWVNRYVEWVKLHLG
jgi:chromate reductase